MTDPTVPADSTAEPTDPDAADPVVPGVTPEELTLGRGRVEPVGIDVEMSRSYLDYAMSVIVSRALPDVRDGLKPVHRKILWGMFDGGYLPDRGYVKCARVVGDVMSNYHPHGDLAIYDALVRMGQPWSLRYPLVDGNGNFGSPGNDRQAAMRYCVTGDTLVRTADGGEVAIASIVPDARPSADHPIDLKVADPLGDPVRASVLFHSGSHPTLRVTTDGGAELTGTHNHPVLAAVPGPGGSLVPEWRLLAELSPGDLLVTGLGMGLVATTTATTTKPIPKPTGEPMASAGLIPGRSP